MVCVVWKAELTWGGRSQGNGHLTLCSSSPPAGHLLPSHGGGSHLSKDPSPSTFALCWRTCILPSLNVEFWGEAQAQHLTMEINTNSNSHCPLSAGSNHRGWRLYASPKGLSLDRSITNHLHTLAVGWRQFQCTVNSSFPLLDLFSVGGGLWRLWIGHLHQSSPPPPTMVLWPPGSSSCLLFMLQ